MRNISSELVEEYSSGNVYPALLAELFFDSQTLGMWSGYGDLEWKGFNFIGGGNLIGISPVKETQDSSAEGIVCTLTGIPSSLISLSLNERVTGRPFRLYIASVNTKSSVLTEDDADKGYILTETGGKIILENQFTTEPYRIFSGLMDVLEFSDNGDTAAIRLSVENVLIRGRSSKVSRYTPEEQKRKYPSDMGLDLINQLQDREVVW